MPGRAAKRWLRTAQHRRSVRAGLDALQAAYRWAGRRRADDRPAAAGGRPVRLVPLPPPQPITSAERRRLRRLAAGQATSFFDGRSVQEFEARLAEAFGARHAIATSSGTAALHTSFMALGVGPGDEVIVPVLTYVATAFAVLQTGAEVRFVDARADDWNMDPAAVEAAITPRTRAICPVHIGGVPCDMDALGAIAARHDLAIVEDAAHAHGCTLDGRAMGTFGALGCFSFGSPKTITTGEGGMVLTDDPELHRRARTAMNLGEVVPDGRPSLEIDLWSPETRLDYAMVGHNYRMSLAQASIGLGQLDRFEAIRARRRENGRRLREAFESHPHLDVQAVPESADVCYYTFPIALREGAPLSRAELLEGLRRERIDFRLWSNLPLAQHAVFRQPGSFPTAERLSRGAVGLRVDPALGRREIEDTIRAVERLLPG